MVADIFICSKALFNTSACVSINACASLEVMMFISSDAPCCLKRPFIIDLNAAFNCSCCFGSIFFANKAQQ